MRNAKERPGKAVRSPSVISRATDTRRAGVTTALEEAIDKESVVMAQLIACPDPTCQAPTRIVDRWTWESTDGPVEHVKTACEGGHWFTPTGDSLRPRIEQVERVPAAV